MAATGLLACAGAGFRGVAERFYGLDTVLLEAVWRTGQTRGAADALRLSQELLPDMVAALGPRHPDTLSTRHKIARWTGQTGECRRVGIADQAA